MPRLESRLNQSPPPATKTRRGSRGSRAIRPMRRVSARPRPIQVAPRSVVLKTPSPSYENPPPLSSPVPTYAVPESTGCVAIDPIDSAVSPSKTAVQLVPPSVETNTPPSAEPSQRWLPSFGSTPSAVTLPPMLIGPALSQDPGADARIPRARACSSARARARAGMAPSPLRRWFKNHDDGKRRSSPWVPGAAQAANPQIAAARMDDACSLMAIFVVPGMCGTPRGGESPRPAPCAKHTPEPASRKEIRGTIDHRERQSQTEAFLAHSLSGNSSFRSLAVALSFVASPPAL